MGNEVAANVETAVAGRHDLGLKALSLLTSPTEVALAELGADAAPAITAAIQRTDAEMAAVPKRGDERSAWNEAMDERLRRLGAKVLPTAGDGAKPWRDALVEALSDLPAMVALTAAKRAIHRPYRFIGEVEPAIREIADEMVARRKNRRAALERMQREIERAAAPQTALPAPDLITSASIRAMKPEFRSLGIRLGYITQGDVDAALAEQSREAA